MKFKVTVSTSRLNPHIESLEIFETHVSNVSKKNTTNLVFVETKNYTDSIVETKSKLNFDLKNQEYDYEIYIRDANGIIKVESELDEEKEINLYKLFQKAEITYFK